MPGREQQFDAGGSGGGGGEEDEGEADDGQLHASDSSSGVHRETLRPSN